MAPLQGRRESEKSQKETRNGVVNWDPDRTAQHLNESSGEGQMGCLKDGRAMEVHAYLFMSVPSSPPQIHAMIYGARDM